MEKTKSGKRIRAQLASLYLNTHQSAFKENVCLSHTWALFWSRESLCSVCVCVCMRAFFVMREITEDATAHRGALASRESIAAANRARRSQGPEIPAGGPLFYRFARRAFPSRAHGRLMAPNYNKLCIVNMSTEPRQNTECVVK